MDIQSIINLVKNIPKDKWEDDKTIRKVLEKAIESNGKSVSNDELNQYVRKFKRVAKSGSPLPLISLLLRQGISKGQIDEIRRKMKR